MNEKKLIDTVLKLDSKKKVDFIILFGSTVKNKNNKLSDIDLAVYFVGTDKERFNFRKLALGELPDKVDLQIFQDLPLTVKKEVITGKVLFYRNYQFVFNEFMKVIKDFNTFEKYYDQYFNQLKDEATA